MRYHIKAVRDGRYVLFRRDEWENDAETTCRRLLELGWTVLITARRST